MVVVVLILKMLPNNIYCPKCDSWLDRREAVKVEEGYECKECNKAAQEIKEFERVGDENFGSNGLKRNCVDVLKSVSGF